MDRGISVLHHHSGGLFYLGICIRPGMSSIYVPGILDVYPYGFCRWKPPQYVCKLFSFNHLLDQPVIIRSGHGLF